LKGFWRSSRFSVNEHSALEKLNLATQNLPMSSWEQQLQKKKSLWKNMMRKTLKKSVQKT
jgi:hypothetical protein